jgi:hypothetical protein
LVEQAKAVDQSCNADGYLNNQSCNSDVSRESPEKMRNKDAFYGNLDPNEITESLSSPHVALSDSEEEKAKADLGILKII